MIAHSIKGNSTDTFQHALNEKLSTGFKPSLAIVFLSVRQDREAVCRILDEAGIAIYGATTNGEFVDEHFEQGTICALLLDTDPSYFYIRYENLDGNEDRKITASLAREALSKFKNPVFLVTASSLQTERKTMASDGLKPVLSFSFNAC